MDFIGMVPLAEEDEAADLSRWIWVQCESPSCLKWRYIPKHEHFDPDKAWFCHMNPDPFFSQCTVPQVSSYKDSILRKKGLKVVYSKLPAGTLVLIKYSKWPLWPAILSPEPSTNQYVDCDGDGDVQQYHVEFLGKPHTRFWADAHKVESFRPLPTSVKSLKGTTRVSYKIAMEEAMDMRDLSCEERLQLCHFQREQLFSQAQGLMESIEGLIAECGIDTKTKQTRRGSTKRCEEVKQERSEESAVDVLIIEGFRFESTATMKEFRQLGLKAPGTGSQT